MKTSIIVVALLASGLSQIQASQYQVVERGADYRVLQKTTYEGGTNRVHRVVELSAGLNYKNSYGQWTESKEEIETFPNGAIAQHGQYQVIFANNLNSTGAIDLQTPDGKRLRSNILGLAYDDRSTGKNVLIAQIQDSQGELISSNQVLYPDAFAGVKADVRYTYKKGSFDQDVILREQPPTPESFGMSSQTTEIEVLTEFIDPPQARIAAHPVQTNSLPDQDIGWGVTRIGRGRAFDLEEPPNSHSRVMVRRQYVTAQNRNILVEGVPIQPIKSSLAKLPLQASSATKLPMLASKTLVLPKTPTAQAEPRPMKLASASTPDKGFLLDYVMLNTDTNDFTFQADTTYFINGEVHIGGTTIFEGGTVIKYPNDTTAFIEIDYYVICPDLTNRPATFTAADDDSVGESMNGIWGGYSGTVSGYYANPAIAFNIPNQSEIQHILSNIRVTYAQQAISDPNSWVGPDYGHLIINDSQIINCHDAVVLSDYGDNQQAELNNCLIANVDSVFLSGNIDGNNDIWYINQSTIDNCSQVVNDPVCPQNESFYATNSIFSNVGNWTMLNGDTSIYWFTLGWSSYNGYYNTPSALPGDNILSSTNWPFQTAGAANYYLATNSLFHDVGTTDIDGDLLAEIQTMTTYAPQDGGWPDTNTPDLGYHYPINEDSDYDGLPDRWEWKYFGNYNKSGTSLDVNGNTLLYDYQNGIDPTSFSNVRLGYWPFDNTNTWVGAEGQLPLLATNVAGVTNWDINAVLIDSTNAAILKYRDIETNGNANINLRSGTVRLWFRPDWSSVSAGGAGPWDQGRLIEMGSQGISTGWWTLMLDTNGNTLSFITQTNGVGMTNLACAISWTSNIWHQVVLTYSASNSSLYIDGQAVVTNGLGVQYWPNETERSAGFRIGSDATGNNQARGVFDELETFNYPLSAVQIEVDYWNCLFLRQTCIPGIGGNLGVSGPYVANPDYIHVGETATIYQLFILNVGTCTLTNLKAWAVFPDSTFAEVLDLNKQSSPNNLLPSFANITCPGGVQCMAFTSTYQVKAGDIGSGLNFQTNWPPGSSFNSSQSGQANSVMFQLAGSASAIRTAVATVPEKSPTPLTVLQPCVGITKVCNGGPFLYRQPIAFAGVITNCSVHQANPSDATLTVNSVSDNPAATINLATTTSSGRTFDGTLQQAESVAYTGSYLPATNLCGPFTDTVQVVVADLTGFTVTNSVTTVCTITILPIVSILSPTNNAIFNVGTTITNVAVGYGCSGTITNIQFFNGTNNLGTAVVAGTNYTLVWTNAPLGSNSLTAVAVDNNGLTNISSTVNFTVLNPLPAVHFVSPTNNQLFVTSPLNMLLTATASASAGTISNVQFLNGNTVLGSGALTNSAYAFLWTNVAAGSYTLKAKATDSNNNCATDSIGIAVNAMPMVSIISPTNIQSFLEVTNVTITAVASDPDGIITNISFLSETNLPFPITVQDVTNFTLVWSNRAAGYYPVTVVATDNRGAQSASHICVFKVNPTNPPPSVAITYPTNGAMFADDSDITITATATANDTSGWITNVEFFVDGQSIGSDPNAPYEIRECCWKPGTYQLMAIATDNLGSSAFSSNVQITVEQESLKSGGFWDPQFGQFLNVTNRGGDAGFGGIHSLASSGAEGSQTVYAGNEYSVFNGANGTNWSQAVFPSDFTELWRDGIFDGFEEDPVPYNAIFADGTNVYAFGPTNRGVLGDGGYYDDDGNGFQLLESSGGTNITLLGNQLNVDVGHKIVVRGIIKVAGDIYVYGDFYSSGSSLTSDLNTNVQYVAKLDRTTNCWLQVGNGLNGGVAAMAAIGNDIYIGGAFTNAGGNTNANYIARLCGNTWTNLGSGVSVSPQPTNSSDFLNIFEFMPVKALAACGLNLYVGGQFTTAGGNTNVHGIAIWNKGVWRSMNGGPGTRTEGYLSAFGITFYGPAYSNWPPVTVNTISVRGDRVYVGGDFAYVVNGDAQGTVTIGEWFDNYNDFGVDDIVLSNRDNGVVPARGIAMAAWNESSQTWTWSSLAGGISEGAGYSVSGYDAVVNCSIIVPGTGPNSYDLYVGGNFASVGSRIYNNGLARWRVGYPLPPSVPSVTITNPINGSIFTNTSAITIAAVASSYTNIEYVEFFADGHDLGGTSESSGSYHFSWSAPTYGLHQLTAAAVDVNGLQGQSKPVLINIMNPSGTVTASNDNYTLFMNSPPATLNVSTNDSTTTSNRLRIVSAYMVQGNVGAVQVNHDNSAVIYTPGVNAYGTDYFAYSVTDGVSTNSAYVIVMVLARPSVEIYKPSSGEQFCASNGVFTVAIGGDAFEYGGSITNMDLYVNGTRCATTNRPTITTNWSTTTAGIYTFKAIVTDADGYTNASSAVTIIAFTTTNQVTGSISNLPISSDGLGGEKYAIVRDGLFDLKGQAKVNGSTNGVLYQVLVHPPDDSGTVIANVTPQADAGGYHENGDSLGDLGILDLSSVANGIYDLELDVYGGGTSTNVTVRFILDTQLKIGQFGFSQQDLVIPVNGVPITVTRTYNSLNPLSSDFGYGWSFAINSMDVSLDEDRENVNVILDDEQRTANVRIGGGRDVTLTLPNGRVATFQCHFDGNDSGNYTPVWQSPPGVAYSLDESDGSFYSGYNGCWDNNENYAFDNYDIAGFVLTDKNGGTKYHITRPVGTVVDYDATGEGGWVEAQVYGPPKLTKIEQRDGNTIQITSNSVAFYTNNAPNPTRSILFDRDGAGRITALYDPNGGPNGLPAVKYVYNQDTGNLIWVLKLVDRSAGTYTANKYRYDNPNFPHYITSMENGDGITVAQNFYDDNGRLTAVQDANGNLTQFIHNITNDMEVVIDRLGHTNTFVYDTHGNVTAQTNALGQVTAMAYDANNNKTNDVTFLNGQSYATNNYVYNLNLNVMLSSTDPLGHTNGFTYDGYGNVLTCSDAKGNPTVNAYDPNTGDLISTTDALGHGSTNSYAGGLLASSSDALGNSTVNSYNGSGNLVGTMALDAASGAILSSNSFNYDNNGNRLTSTVWRRAGTSWVSSTTTSIYDAMNRVTQTIDPDGGTNTVVYDLNGKQQTTIDKLGHTNSYTYDSQSRLIQTTYPDMATESSTYDAAGNRITSTDKAGRTTTYVYDALNRQTQTIYPDSTTNTTVYDGVGRVAQTIDARGTVTAFNYDAAGRRIAVTNAVGLTVQTVSTYGYDANGNQITSTDANQNTTTNIFDALNRQMEVDYANGTKTFTGYDADGRRVAETNQDGIVTLFGYDGVGRLMSVTNGLNTAQQMVTRYQYDSEGNEVAQIDALGRTNTYAYDGMGRRIAHALPGGQFESFGYDVAGNLIYQTNFNGAAITNQYDVMNRLTNVVSVNGYHVGYTYRVTGQRQTMSDAGGVTSYSYDNRDRLVIKTVAWNSGPTVSLNYRYDANGNVTNIWSSPSNGVNLAYSYDPLSRLTNVLANGASAASYGFDLVGNLQAMCYGNGVTNLYQYDSLNRLTNSVWKTNGIVISSFAYTLGLTGNRTALTETNNGANRNYTWSYDALYRLTNETVTGAAPTGTLGYSYDAVGNRTVRTNITGGLGLANQTPTYNTNDWFTSDQYDANGNTTNSASNYYRYDVMNHVTNVNNGTVIITYDGDGNRVIKTVGGTTSYYLLDDRNPSSYAQVLEEWTSTGTPALTRVYNYSLALISQRQVSSGTVSYYGSDGHGSMRFLLDASGNITDTYAYDAYGTIIASTGSTTNNYLYCGQQWDPDFGFYYDRARYLNPNIGRFWTMDKYDGRTKEPISFNKYLYCWGNPVNRLDLDGRDAVILVGRNKANPEYFTRIANKEASAYRMYERKKAFVFQVRDFDDVQNALKTPNIDELVYFGHSDESYLFLSDMAIAVKDVEKLDFSNVQNPAFIGLFGCSTAAGQDSIAAAFANRLKQPVIGYTSGLSFGIPFRFGISRDYSFYVCTFFPSFRRGDQTVVLPKGGYTRPDVPFFSYGIDTSFDGL